MAMSWVPKAFSTITRIQICPKLFVLRYSPVHLGVWLARSLGTSGAHSGRLRKRLQNILFDEVLITVS